MNTKMRAAVFKRTGVLEIEKVAVPQIEAPDEIIVEVELCSICGTDVHIMEIPPGYEALPNTILGHELVGKVVSIGDAVTTIKPGDRVVTNPNDYCGACEYCKQNLPNFCINIKPMGIETNGGFAEYVKLTEKVAYKISDDLPAKYAAFAEPLACLMNGRQKLPVKPGDSVLICGAGAIGLLFVQIFKNSGAYPIIVSEPVESRRKTALEVGADFVVDPTVGDVTGSIFAHTSIGADYAIDVVGSQLQTCLNGTRKGGTILLFGLNSKSQALLMQSEITMSEKKVLGTWIANASFIPAVRILESGMLNLDPLITHTLPLEKIIEGIEILKNGEGIEVLIDPKL